MAGIYIHIPFCKKRCIYCDFYSNTDTALQESYVDAVCCELAGRREELRSEPVATLYLGGGTPSQLTPGSLNRIFETVARLFPLEKEAEITLEANPDDLNETYCRALAALPVNRISLGVQSFDDRDLRFLNRRHDAEGAETAVSNCREAGFRNISLDLIYGLPQQTTDGWQRNLQRALALAPQHLSCYHLIYEEGTALHRLLKNGSISGVDEESSLNMFSTLIGEAKTAGYHHYEISNFARPGYESRHNSSYWQGKAYLGIGASAHSYDGHTLRRMNIADIEAYIEAVRTGKPFGETEQLTVTDLYNERILTALRTDTGLNLNEVKERFGEKRQAYCLRQSEPHLNSNRLIRNGDTLVLSSEGIFISDSIMSDLMWVD